MRPLFPPTRYDKSSAVNQSSTPGKSDSHIFYCFIIKVRRWPDRKARKTDRRGDREDERGDGKKRTEEKGKNGRRDKGSRWSGVYDLTNLTESYSADFPSNSARFMEILGERAKVEKLQKRRRVDDFLVRKTNRPFGNAREKRTIGKLVEQRCFIEDHAIYGSEDALEAEPLFNPPDASLIY